MSKLIHFLRDEGGTTAVEYAVMLALIIVTCIGTISFFGSEAGGSLVSTSDKLSEAMSHP